MLPKSFLLNPSTTEDTIISDLDTALKFNKTSQLWTFNNPSGGYTGNYYIYGLNL